MKKLSIILGMALSISVMAESSAKKDISKLSQQLAFGCYTYPDGQTLCW